MRYEAKRKGCDTRAAPRNVDGIHWRGIGCVVQKGKKPPGMGGRRGGLRFGFLLSP